MSTNIHHSTSLIKEAERLKLSGWPQAKTLWLTGLSGSGKSTIAKLFERQCIDKARLSYRLDGDNVRFGLCGDLDFSMQARTENIRRVAEVAKLFNQAGVFVVVSLISPLASERARAREIVGENAFTEVFVKCSLAACEQRDPKGLYQKARAGEIKEFTGISSPYEEPENPDILLDTEVDSVEVCVEKLWGYLGPN